MSHSIVNSCKRVVVIVLAVLYFHNPVSPLNMMGVALTLGGVYLYERSMRLTPPHPAAGAPIVIEEPDKIIRLNSDEDASLLAPVYDSPVPYDDGKTSLLPR